MSVNIRSALENLKEEDIDRLRLKLRRRFGEQLRKIPTIPDMAKFPSRDTEALFQEAVKDLLEDRRRCPTETKKALLGCLYNIVRSKVSHIQSKWNDVKKEKRRGRMGMLWKTNLQISTGGKSISMIWENPAMLLFNK